MSFRFLHTADWQLGKPFTRFDPGLRGRLEAARLETISRMADAARRGGAGHVLVAGDVFDQEQPSDAILSRSLARLAAADDLHWWLLPGNHDPAGRESLWQRAARQGLPAHVHLLTEAKPTTMAPGVSLLPAPWTSKRPGRDLTEEWDDWATPEGDVRLGIAHGGTQGFGSEAEDEVIIDPRRAERAGLSYLALGDWHGLKQAAPRTWYSGTPEPDGFRNNQQGYALLVELGQAPEAIPTASFDWRLERLETDRVSDPCAAFEAMFPAGVVDHVLIRADLAGHLSLRDWAIIETAAALHTARLACFELRTAELSVSAQESDLDALRDGPFASVVSRLLGGDKDSDTREKAL
ncbi:MAG: DNA repair exonuclease, partial [Parvularcula sp.]|nr:DNA repair exonuclease [Parvularcula sp.]